MRVVYSLADVHFITPMGEGWSLTAMESMACRVPQLIPNHSALAEWPKDAVEYIDVSPIPFFNTKGLNTHGAVPDMESAIAGLQKLYSDKTYREALAIKGYERVMQPQYEWKNIAREFEKVFNSIQQRNVDDD